MSPAAGSAPIHTYWEGHAHIFFTAARGHIFLFKMNQTFRDVFAARAAFASLLHLSFYTY
jgi:hypothetical protein